MLEFVKDSNHYSEVLSRVSSVKHTLWIGIADINV